VAGREGGRGLRQTDVGLWFGAKPAQSETPVRAAAAPSFSPTALARQCAWHFRLTSGQNVYWLHQLAMKPRDSCGPREHCLRYPVFYCTVWITEAVLLAMFESPSYVTVTVVVPAGRDDVVSFALPALS
jgi:hypothetical protein